MSEFYLKRGKSQKVTDEQILEAFERNRFNSLSEAARYIAANYAPDGSFTNAALAKRLKTLGYQCVNGKLQEYHELNLENALAGVVLTNLNEITEEDKDIEFGLEYAKAVIEILFTGQYTGDNDVVDMLVNSLGMDGKFLYELHKRLKVNANDR